MNVSLTLQLNLSVATENLTEALKKSVGERITETNLFAGFTAFLRQSGIFAKAPNTLIFHDDKAPAGNFSAWAPTVEELNEIDRAVQFLNANSPARPGSPLSATQPSTESAEAAARNPAFTRAGPPKGGTTNAPSTRLPVEITDFIQQTNFMSGLERELSRQIAQMDGVEAAKVMIAHPVGDLIRHNAQVFLKRRGDTPLNASTVNAIRFLVANAVEGLKAGNVAVADDAGNILSNPPPAQTPPASPSKQTALAQINDARILIELGKLDEAEAKLESALKLEPDNKRALSYLSFIKEMRQATKSEIQTIFKQALADFEKAQPDPNAEAQWNRSPNQSRAVSPHRQAILDKLESIVLDEVTYDGVALSDVVKDLSQRARKLSPPGLNFLINSFLLTPPTDAGPGVVYDPVTGQPSARPSAPDPIDLNKVMIRIDPPLRNVKREAAPRARRHHQSHGQAATIRHRRLRRGDHATRARPAATVHADVSSRSEHVPQDDVPGHGRLRGRRRCAHESQRDGAVILPSGGCRSANDDWARRRISWKFESVGDASLPGPGECAKGRFLQ